MTDTAAIFYVDGEIVERFSAADMPGGIWNIGPMKSDVDLWAVAPGQEEWAGRWVDTGEPLIGRIAGADIRSGEYGSNFVAHHPDVGNPGPDPVPGFPLFPADAPPGSFGANRLRGMQTTTFSTVQAVWIRSSEEQDTTGCTACRKRRSERWCR